MAGFLSSVVGAALFLGCCGFVQGGAVDVEMQVAGGFWVFVFGLLGMLIRQFRGFPWHWLYRRPQITLILVLRWVELLRASLLVPPHGCAL